MHTSEPMPVPATYVCNELTLLKHYSATTGFIVTGRAQETNAVDCQKRASILKFNQLIHLFG